MGINAITVGIWAAAALSSGGSEDPYWSYVSMLLHADDLTDSSSYEHSYISINNVSVVSNNIRLASTASYMRYKTVSELKMESDDFTIEFHVTAINLTADGNIVSNGEAYTISIPNYRVELLSTGKIRFLFGKSYYRYGSIIGDIESTLSISVGVKTHVAITKSGTTYRIFIGGLLDKEAVYATAPYDTTTQAFFAIGNNSVSGSAVADIDNLRITKGVARYTSNFTPPTQAFPNN